MALAVPALIIPGSYNSTLIKLLIFTVCSALLLFILGYKMIMGYALRWDRLYPLLLLAPAMTLLHRYAPSNPGVTRILLVCSATGIFVSIRAFCQDRKKILIPVIAGGALAILVSITMPSSSARASGLFSNANLLGSFAAGLLPVGAAFLFKKSPGRLSLSFAFLVITLTGIYMSGTRSSILALAMAITAVFIISRKPGLIHLFFVLFLIAVVAEVAFPGLPVPEFGGTPGVRQVIWEGSSKMFLQKPVFGWGNGSFQLVFPGFRPPDFIIRGVSSNTVHAHSEPLEILAENGLTGLAVWLILIALLLKRAVYEPKKTLMDWGIITGVFVLLLESLVSVALRWTTSVYLLAILLSLLPGENYGGGLKRLHRWTAVLPLSAGLLLLFPGAYSAYRMTRASMCLNSALEAMETGESAEQIRAHCLRSIDLNSWELGSWYMLGNVYGSEAEMIPDNHTAADLIGRQLAAYDSLAARAPDFAWMRVNRVGANMNLGRFDCAMDDLIILLRSNRDLHDYCLNTGFSIIPYVSPGKAFELMNLVFLEEYVANSPGGSPDSSSPRRSWLLKQSILTNFALAGINAPGSVQRMMQDTDSILVQCADSLRDRIHVEVENELAIAEEGFQLFQRFRRGDYEGIEEHCLMTISRENTYGTYQRAVLCLNAARLGKIEYLEMASDYSSLLANQCLQLVPYYPGAEGIILACAELSAQAGGPEHLSRIQRYLGFALMIDSYSASSAGAALSCRDNPPPRDALDFWLANGGPMASAALISSDRLLVPMGQTERIIQAAATESPEFQASVSFILGSMAISSSIADSDRIRTETLLDLNNVMNALTEMYSKEEAERIISSIMNNGIAFFETVLFNSASADIARQMKSDFQSGDIQPGL